MYIAKILCTLHPFPFTSPPPPLGHISVIGNYGGAGRKPKCSTLCKPLGSLVSIVVHEKSLSTGSQLLPGQEGSEGLMKEIWPPLARHQCSQLLERDTSQPCLRSGTRCSVCPGLPTGLDTHGHKDGEVVRDTDGKLQWQEGQHRKRLLQQCVKVIWRGKEQKIKLDRRKTK